MNGIRDVLVVDAYAMLAALRRPMRRALVSLGGVGGWKVDQLRLKHWARESIVNVGFQIRSI